jgi:hypothetical protein
VRREPQTCGNFVWAEYHATGAGGLAVPPAVDFAMSPNSGFAAYLVADPVDCSAPRRLVVKDMSTFTDATLEVPPGSSQLEWSADGSDLAFSTEEPDALTAEGSIRSVSITDELVAANTLSSSPVIESDAECFVGNPSLGPDGRRWYTKACGTSVSINATAVGSQGTPTEIEVSATDPGWVRSLTVNRVTGQVAVVANDDTAWILDGDVLRPLLDESGAPVVGISDLLWPDVL